MTAPAWYVIPSQRWWARWLNVLHLPYSAWHLCYPVIGAMLADSVNWPLVGWTVLAFFLGMGVAAHSYDLLKGDPLRLGLRPLHLGIVGGVALTGAVVIGLLQVSLGNVSVWLLMAITVGILVVLGYNLEWPCFHGDWQFATWWAVFPLLVGYFTQGIDHHPALVAVAVFAFTSGYAQRVLSKRARYLRRQVHHVAVYLEQEDGEVGGNGKSWLLAPLDQTLLWMTAMMVTLALGLVFLRLLEGQVAGNY